MHHHTNANTQPKLWSVVNDVSASERVDVRIDESNIEGCHFCTRYSFGCNCKCFWVLYIVVFFFLSVVWIRHINFREKIRPFRCLVMATKSARHFWVQMEILATIISLGSEPYRVFVCIYMHFGLVAHWNCTRSMNYSRIYLYIIVRWIK